MWFLDCWRWSEESQIIIDNIFEKYENIYFEADDCDEFAMELKKLFNIADDVTWDIYIYKGNYGYGS